MLLVITLLTGAYSIRPNSGWNATLWCSEITVYKVLNIDSFSYKKASEFASGGLYSPPGAVWSMCKVKSNIGSPWLKKSPLVTAFNILGFHCKSLLNRWMWSYLKRGRTFVWFYFVMSQESEGRWSATETSKQRTIWTLLLLISSKYDNHSHRLSKTLQMTHFTARLQLIITTWKLLFKNWRCFLCITKIPAVSFTLAHNQT